MPTYILTRNPEKSSPWEELDDDAEQTAQGISLRYRWSTGNTKRIQPGDRLFLLKQGPQPRGIIGIGEAISTVYSDEHWNGEGNPANYVDLEIKRLLDPAVNLPLSTDNFEGALGEVYWRMPASGIRIPDDAARQLEAAWAEHLRQVDGAENEDVEETEDEEVFPEGRLLYRLHRARERDPLLVKKVKARALRQHGRLFCCVCEFDFAERYGPIGNGFIECHHTKPLSELVAETATKLSDLALLCSNCHRMIHRKRPWLNTDQLGQLLKA